MKDYELLEKQASMMRMAEKHGIDHWMKLVRFNMMVYNPITAFYGTNFEYALGVVEGRPVFEGDTLWNVPNNFSFVVSRVTKMYLGEADCFFSSAPKYRCGWIKDCSWNPPKPKTIDVPMPIELAEYYAEYQGNRMGLVCRKALEAIK